MGLGASQARFLTLTARKTNIEFQGQQINQQRTTLANQSSNMYSQMLNLQVPTMPSRDQFQKTVYTVSNIDGISGDAKISSITKSINKTEEGKFLYTIILSYTQDNKTSTKVLSNVELGISQNARISSLTFDGKSYPVAAGSEYDAAAYEDAENEYKYQNILYEQKLNTINSSLSILQDEDKKLELRLKQLDTEQNAVKTEMDSIKEVIKKNIETTFKTFA